MPCINIMPCENRDNLTCSFSICVPLASFPALWLWQKLPEAYWMLGMQVVNLVWFYLSMEILLAFLYSTYASCELSYTVLYFKIYPFYILNHNWRLYFNQILFLHLGIQFYCCYASFCWCDVFIYYIYWFTYAIPCLDPWG